MSINVIEKFLYIPIDYYVQINMYGFKEIIDSVVELISKMIWISHRTSPFP
jgi:anionic cell wall polymer biosynthesis LytR-Cps2A-Psr (LCP) family protein